MDSKIQELYELNLIDLAQTKEMNELTSNLDEKYNSTYINALFRIKFKELTGYEYSSLTTTFFESEILNNENQIKLNSSLNELLKKIEFCGLINKIQYDQYVNYINSNEFTLELLFLKDLANFVAFEEWINPNNLELFSTKMYENKIISKEENKRLIKAIKNKKIKTPYQLLDFCKQAIFFDLSKFSNDPNIYLEKIHKETSQILTELNFTNFDFEIKVDSLSSYGDYISHDLVVELYSNQTVYKQKSFISPDNIGVDNNFLGKIDEQEYYKIFNKILIDSKSPYRLHLVRSNYNHRQVSYQQYYGIIALKKEQVDMFRTGGSYLDLSYENYQNNLSSSEITKIINDYKRIGLLNHLDKGQIEQSILKIAENNMRNINDILYSFPNTILSFDVELDNLENPYEEIIKGYSDISHKQFNPKNVTDNFDLQKDKVNLEFIINDKKYQKDIEVHSDWIDTNIFEFIKNVVKENNLNGQFYELYGDGANIIYLTPKQYKFIRKNKLLIFGDEWESQLED